MKKIYYQKEIFNNSYRWNIFPLIKFLNLNPEFQNDIMFCDHPQEADVILLPMSWNYYYKTKQLKTVKLYYQNYKSTNKLVFSFIIGDVGSKVPEFYKGFVLRASGDKSKLSDKHIGMPIFVEDPLDKFFSTKLVFKRPFSNLPIIGFCGQANNFRFKTISDVLRVGVKNLLSRVGYSYSNPQKLMSTTYFRYKILRRLQHASSIKTNFIIRDQYRAGVTRDKDSHSSTLEFYDNIKNSDYVLCMRGAGNFSNRFYETLAMGRIPVFVNTDCLLPLETVINWKKHVVWVEYKDRNNITDKILEFHTKLDEIKLNELFELNRKLWENQLTLASYFKTLLYENT